MKSYIICLSVPNILLGTVTSGFMYVLTNSIIPSYIYIPHFVYTFINCHLDLFPVVTLANNVPVNIGFQISLEDINSLLFGYMRGLQKFIESGHSAW